MASQILSTLKQRIESFELEPSDGGCFELTVNGELVYSKIATGQFPEEADMVSKLKSLA